MVMMRAVVLAVCSVGALSVSGSAVAQRTLTFVNASPPVVIPLADVPVEFGSKTVTVSCALDAQGACPISARAPAPSLAFSCSGCGSARVGQAVSLTWGSSTADLCVAYSTGPAGTSWQGQQSTAAIGRSLLFSVAGTYALTMKCYGSGGATPVRTVSAIVSN